MIALGLGLGPARPMLNLAMQNAVPREDMGAATASRQFFQQIGQVVGSAVFGTVLTTVLTTALMANLAPITAQLPAAMAAQFDLIALRNGVSACEGEGGAGATDPAARIEQAITERFAIQRDLLTRALREGEPEATQTLLADPQTPEQLRALLATTATLPTQTREQALTQLLANLDTAQREALTQGRQLGEELSYAVKRSFTESITSIYRYAIVLAVIGLLLTFLLPQLPLRATHQSEPAVMME